MPDAHRLLHHVLDGRLVDDRQHLLRLRLGGGEEAGAQPGGGDDGLADVGHGARFYSLGPARQSRARLAAPQPLDVPAVARRRRARRTPRTRRPHRAGRPTRGRTRGARPPRRPSPPTRRRWPHGDEPHRGEAPAPGTGSSTSAMPAPVATPLPPRKRRGDRARRGPGTAARPHATPTARFPTGQPDPGRRAPFPTSPASTSGARAPAHGAERVRGARVPRSLRGGVPPGPAAHQERRWGTSPGGRPAPRGARPDPRGPPYGRTQRAAREPSPLRWHSPRSSASGGSDVPTYEYRCKECGEELEVVQSFTDDALTTCEACGGPLRKVFGSVGHRVQGQRLLQERQPGQDLRHGGHRRQGQRHELRQRRQGRRPRDSGSSTKHAAPPPAATQPAEGRPRPRRAPRAPDALPPAARRPLASRAASPA